MLIYKKLYIKIILQKQLISRIVLGRDQIDPIDISKFLGVHVNKYLVFQTHFDNLANNISTAIGISFGLNRYQSLVHSYFLYTIEAWHSASETHLNNVKNNAKEMYQSN